MPLSQPREWRQLVAMGISHGVAVSLFSKAPKGRQEKPQSAEGAPRERRGSAEGAPRERQIVSARWLFCKHFIVERQPYD
jgi:hypothetical protein